MTADRSNAFQEWEHRLRRLAGVVEQRRVEGVPFVERQAAPTVDAHSQPLVAWSEINRLTWLPFVAPPWVEVHRDGTVVPVISYCDHVEARGLLPGHDVLNPRRLENLLSEGATLILNWMELAFPAVARATELLMDALQVPVRGNVYVSGPRSAALGCHWDGAEAIVVQVEGCKRWTFWAPGRGDPLSRDVAFDPDPSPDAIPWIEVELEPGDVVFVPRGWWHEVTGADMAPSVHVTFVCRRPNGADVVAWLLDEALAHEAVRADLPPAGNSDARRARSEALLAVLRAGCSDGLVGAFYDHVDATAVRRSSMSLPWSTTGPPAPSGVDSARTLRVASAAPWSIRPRPLPDGSSDVEVAANGRRWVLAGAAAGLLDAVLGGAVVRLEDVAGFADAGATVDDLLGLVHTLVCDGLLRYVAEPAPGG